MKPAFEVINPKTGHRYAVYPDGRIDGFGEATLVINRIPALIAQSTLDRLNQINANQAGSQIAPASFD